MLYSGSKEVNNLFDKDEILEKEHYKYKREAKDLMGNQQKIKSLLNKAIKKATHKKGHLGEAWDKLHLFIELVKDYSKGEYRNITTSTIITVIVAIIYFVSPFDLVPDFVIGLGIFDDAAVIGYTIKKISAELDDYTKWKQSSDLR